ncbi:MAG: hypothetical protein U5K43_05680 [Halofilum sp. (in: g-proteobacteria)]|nr:hypothetical protein [Halofilum sp. (in: g-proteobacteria)]
MVAILVFVFALAHGPSVAAEWEVVDRSGTWTLSRYIGVVGGQEPGLAAATHVVGHGASDYRFLVGAECVEASDPRDRDDIPARIARRHACRRVLRF